MWGPHFTSMFGVKYFFLVANIFHAIISYRHSEHSYYSESEYSLDGDSWKQRSVNTG